MAALNGWRTSNDDAVPSRPVHVDQFQHPAWTLAVLPCLGFDHGVAVSSRARLTRDWRLEQARHRSRLGR